MRGLEDGWKDKVTFLRKGTQEPGTVEMMEKLGFAGTPSVIVLDAQGHDVDRFMGLKSGDEINALLHKATASK